MTHSTRASSPAPTGTASTTVGLFKLVRRFVLAAGGIFATWMLLAGRLDGQEMMVGGGVSVAIALLSMRHLRMLDDVRLGPLMPLHLVRYFIVFFGALIRANLDVARRVVTPRVRIEPAMVTVHTELRSDLGKLWLANSITLTPGTLTVDVEGQDLIVHWIDASPGTDLTVATREIAARFERPMKEFLR